jgi:hypothetical protein
LAVFFYQAEIRRVTANGISIFCLFLARTTTRCQLSACEEVTNDAPLSSSELEFQFVHDKGKGGLGEGAEQEACI